MNLEGFDAAVTALQAHRDECTGEIGSGRVASSVTDEYNRALGHDRQHLDELLEALTRVRNALTDLDAAKLTQAQADALYAPLGGGGGAQFPVGWLLLSLVNVNPATFLGYGAWTNVGAGRVLVGLDALDPDFNAPEKTAGAKTVAAAGAVSAPVITVSPLAGGTRKGGTSNPASIIENGNTPTATASAPTFTGSATSVVQPSLVAYFWKRTA